MSTALHSFIDIFDTEFGERQDAVQLKKITIPIIQRDYAQGRKDKGFIRKNFLKSIKDSLEKNENLTLDFVYGNTEGEKFFPLDGQQRLTTLWLVYWYLSYKAGSW